MNRCLKAENQKKAPESEALDQVVRSDVLFRVFGAHPLQKRDQEKVIERDPPLAIVTGRLNLFRFIQMIVS